MWGSSRDRGTLRVANSAFLLLELGVHNRILVTGAAGFVGSHLSEALAGRGDHVVGLDNFDNYYEPAAKRRNLREVARALGRTHDFEFIEGDVRDKGLVGELCARHEFDAIVHLAALAGVRASVDQADRYFDVNVAGTLRLLDACVAHGIPRFVFASSSSVYGNAERIPSEEDDDCDRPLAPYPASKRSCEVLGHAYHHMHGLSFVGLRLFTIFGPRNRPDMMAYTLLQSAVNGQEITLYEDGFLKRDWTYIADIVQGIVAAVDRPLGYEIINLGRSEPIMVRDLVEIVERLSGRKIIVRRTCAPVGDVRETCASLDKARRLLGYAPTTHVSEGMARMWTWYCGR